VLLDEVAAAMLDEQSGDAWKWSGVGKAGPTAHHLEQIADGITAHSTKRYERIRSDYGDSGGASRFFYTAKASASPTVATATTTHGQAHRPDQVPLHG
jgi:hypothetical protein